MTCIVIVDMRQNNGQVCGIEEGEGGQWLAQFPDFVAAEAAMTGHLLGAFPRWVFDLDTGKIRGENLTPALLKKWDLRIPAPDMPGKPPVL